MRRFLTKKDLKLKKKQTIYTIIGVVVIIGIYLFLTREKKTEPEAPIVSVAPAQQQDVEIYGEYVGRIRAQQFVEVRARVEGFLEQMLFEEGTQVKRNQVLFIINQDQYQAKVDKARAQLKKDEATARKAERDLNRIRPLYEQRAASQLDLDNATAAYETAVASVGMSQADLDQAEQELSYTVVRSPITGQISERHVDLGTLVGTSGKSLLATIVKSDTVLVDFSMTALDYLKSKERKSALQLLDEIVRDGNDTLCVDALTLAAENGRTDTDSIRQCYYMIARKEFRPDPLKLVSTTPILDYNPNLSAYDGLMGGEVNV